MALDTATPDALTDVALLESAQVLASATRGSTAELVAHLGVIDARALYLGLGFSSMFAYCREVLRLRVAATTASRRHGPRAGSP